MLQAGDTIDIWVVDKQLGKGGMGSVYRCHNRNANRILAAVKVLETAVRSSPDAEARFVREAEIMFQLDHPSIVKVRNVRMDVEPPYLEMEFVEGSALEDMLQEGAIPLKRCLELMEQAAGALAYLHARGIRHRDIKPANLLVDRKGRLKLVDFGLAMETDSTRITQTGMAFGTVSYAPPEWVKPESLDPEQWDIYALGVVFWEMLTGKMAFPSSGQGSARQQAMQVIVSKQGHDPLDPGTQFPSALREIIKHCTHPDPAQRLSSSRDLWERCRELLTDSSGGGVTLAPAGLDLDALTPLPPKRVEPSQTWNDGVELDSQPEQPSVEPSSRRLTLVALVALSLVGLLAMVGLGVIVGLLLLPESSAVPETRPVEVLVLGVPEELPVQVRIGEQAGTRSAEGIHFDDVVPGEVELAWVMGEGCPLEPCPGPDCPAYCPSGTRTLPLEAGEGSAILRLTLSPPADRAVAIPTTRADITRASLGPATGGVVDGKLSFTVRPGRHELAVVAGSCTPDDRGCAEREACPAGCFSTVRTVEIPVGDDPMELAVDLGSPAAVEPGPAPRVTPTPTPSEEPQPTPVPAPAGGMGSLVTHAQFAKFIEAKADFAPGGKYAAAGPYLQGWDGATPPAGTGATPVINVSLSVAARYCAWRGAKLPEASAGPAASGMMEFRIADGGSFVAVDDQGIQTPEFNPKRANSFVGFRCSR